MELSAQALGGLQVLSRTDVFSFAAFKIFVDCNLKHLASMKASASPSYGQAFGANAAFSKIDPIFLKQAQLGLATLVLEAAKRGYDSDLIGQAVAGVLSNEASSYLCGEYEEYRERIRRGPLAQYGFGSAKIIDIKWQLEYVVKSGGRERVQQPVWAITLITQGTSQNIRFHCNEEQMQALLFSLEDATKSVDRTLDQK